MYIHCFSNLWRMFKAFSKLSTILKKYFHFDRWSNSGRNVCVRDDDWGWSRDQEGAVYLPLLWPGDDHHPQQEGHQDQPRLQEEYRLRVIPFMYSLFWELRGLSPNFHIHVSVSDFDIPRIGPHIFLQQKGRSMVGVYKPLIYRHMNVEIRLWPRNSFSGNIWVTRKRMKAGA